MVSVVGFAGAGIVRLKVVRSVHGPWVTLLSSRKFARTCHEIGPSPVSLTSATLVDSTPFASLQDAPPWHTRCTSYDAAPVTGSHDQSGIMAPWSSLVTVSNVGVGYDCVNG